MERPTNTTHIDNWRQRVSQVCDKILDRYLSTRFMGALLVAAVIFFGVGGYIIANGNTFDIHALAQDFYANVTAELASISVTILIIDRLNERRQSKEEKQRLIAQMGSPYNQVAVEAVRILRTRNWLQSHELEGANLMNADLSGADLTGANLRSAKLDGAKLVGAKVEYANLSGASLRDADLTEADFSYANLQDANLNLAKLTRSHIDHVNFQNALLYAATLIGANAFASDFTNARFNDSDLTSANFMETKIRADQIQLATLHNTLLPPDVEQVLYPDKEADLI